MNLGVQIAADTASGVAKKDKMQEAIAASQQEVIVAAEQKLGRSLTETERRGIQRINSLMMLGSCHQSFSSPVSQVLAGLEYFAKQAQKLRDKRSTIRMQPIRRP